MRRTIGKFTQPAEKTYSGSTLHFTLIVVAARAADA
jgi:hypothetical protein